LPSPTPAVAAASIAPPPIIGTVEAISKAIISHSAEKGEEKLKNTLRLITGN